MDTVIIAWGWIAIAAAWVLTALAIGLLVGRAISVADLRERRRR